MEETIPLWPYCLRVFFGMYNISPYYLLPQTSLVRPSPAAPAVTVSMPLVALPTRARLPAPRTEAGDSDNGSKRQRLEEPLSRRVSLLNQAIEKGDQLGQFGNFESLDYEHNTRGEDGHEDDVAVEETSAPIGTGRQPLGGCNRPYKEPGRSAGAQRTSTRRSKGVKKKHA